ncbi:hypothetical protein [Deinococcus yunweiensis]|uniref:hypothetical protein n=1 Tax=Deinococcus yunweiensis TaxID=367282 RepID=UPI00398EBFD0
MIPRFLLTLLVLLPLLLGTAHAAPVDACTTTPAVLQTYRAHATPNEIPFVRIQERVVEIGCAHLSSFDDPAWFPRTLPVFIGKFLAQGSGWPAVASGCAAPLTGPLTCGELMVREHLYADLVAALRVAGCGTEADWARMGGYVQTAIAQEGPLWAWGASIVMPMRRLEVRLRCVRGDW